MNHGVEGKDTQYLFQRGGIYDFLDSNHRKAANRQRQMKQIIKCQFSPLLKFSFVFIQRVARMRWAEHAAQMDTS
jgi:hypothetical protein